MKKSALAIVLAVWLGACATFEPPLPSFYIEDLPSALTLQMSLEERIAAEDAWNDLKAGKTVRAEKEFRRLGSDNPIFHVGLGYLRFQADDYPAAEQSFQEALRRAPNMILAYLGLAQLDQMRGLEDQVYSWYQEILKREPDHPWVRPKFESLQNKITEELLAEAKRSLEGKDIEGGKKSFLKALFYSPESTEANLNLARIYRKEKNAASAILHYEAASAGDPTNKTILKEYAETLYEAEQFGRSLDIFELLAEKEPQNKTLKERIESLKNKLGIYELPSRYNDIPAVEAIAREDLAALIAVKFKGILNDSNVKPPILIDISNSWAVKFILKITGLGIMEVFENHTFLPKKIINRAELAETMLRLINHLKAKGYSLTMQIPPDKIQLSDVSPDNYFYGPITRIIAYQIMDLPSQRMFRPDAVIGGSEAAKILDITLALIQ